MSSAARSVVAAVLCGLLAAACTTQALPSLNGTPTSGAAEQTAGEGEASPGPGESGTPGETEPPGGLPTEAPPTVAPGSAGCSGSLDNRTFFEQIAGQVSWDVYCAVLPHGWFVETGNFSLRDGGRMVITYKGPNGAHFTLQQGAICADGGDACAPHGQDLGPASIGDHQGELFGLGDGSFAVFSGGGSPSWNVSGTAVDQATFAGFVSGLHLVAP